MTTEPLRLKLNFFDDFWVDFRPGTTRRWFQPAFQTHYADIDFMGNSYSSLLYHPESGKFRLYYEVSPDWADDSVRYLALAESDDGLHFTPVDVRNTGEKRMRRIVYDGGTGVHGTGVMYDSRDPDPARRFKLTSVAHQKERQGSVTLYPITAAFSADGIHWTEPPGECVVHPYSSDAYNNLFFNPTTGEYCLIHRGVGIDRRISMRTSKDFVHWTDPVLIGYPGASYNSDLTQMQFYSMWAGWVDGIFYGLVWWFSTSLVDMDFPKMWGTMDTELLYSYDGRNFMRSSGRLLVERPAPPALGCFQLYLMGMVENRAGDEYILQGIGSKCTHGDSGESNKKYTEKLGRPTFASVFYTIRKDGFCGLEGIRNGTQVILKKMEIVKPDISFNINAAAGWARFGLMEPNGKFLDGFSYDDCVPFEGDGVSVTPTWKNARLESVVGKGQVRIAVELNSAILHAMNATVRPWTTERQRTFGDPVAVM